MIRVLDTSVIINLFNGEILKLACSTSHIYGFGSEVESECNDQVLSYFTTNNIPYERINDDHIPAATFIDLKVKKKLGGGEAECIAFCMENPKSILFTDDLQARKLVVSLLGAERLSGSIGILKELVKTDKITHEGAFVSYQKMIEAGGFLPKLEEHTLLENSL